MRWLAFEIVNKQEREKDFGRVCMAIWNGLLNLAARGSRFVWAKEPTKDEFTKPLDFVATRIGLEDGKKKKRRRRFQTLEESQAPLMALTGVDKLVHKTSEPAPEMTPADIEAAARILQTFRRRKP